MDDIDEPTPELVRAAALATALRMAFGKLKRRLREASSGDLTGSQIAVLSHLDREGPATVSALARLEGVRSQSMGATVATLEAAGLVAGASDPADGRQTLWSLTLACREMIDAGRAARQDWLLRAIHARMRPDELESLAAAVALLQRLADAEV